MDLFTSIFDSENPNDYLFNSHFVDASMPLPSCEEMQLVRDVLATSKCFYRFLQIQTRLTSDKLDYILAILIEEGTASYTFKKGRPVFWIKRDECQTEQVVAVMKQMDFEFL
jgi:hypothetical protein